jgi:hypothetical protein
MLNSVEGTPSMVQLRDSSQGQHEVGFSIQPNGSSYAVAPGTTLVGTAGSVTSYYSWFANSSIHFVGRVHLHEKGGDPNPDPADQYNLMSAAANKTDPSYNPLMKYSFVICGDTLIDLAMAVYDTSKTGAFLRSYPKSSGLGYDTTYFADGSGIIGPTWAKFKIAGDSLSMKQEFVDAVNAIKSANYPKELRSTYAQVYMMSRYNTGTRLMIKVNGIFKELTPVYSRNSAGILSLKINICN